MIGTRFAWNPALGHRRRDDTPVAVVAVGAWEEKSLCFEHKGDRFGSKDGPDRRVRRRVRRRECRWACVGCTHVPVADSAHRSHCAGGLSRGF